MSGVWVCMMGGTLVGIAAVSMMLAMRRVMTMMEGPFHLDGSGEMLTVPLDGSDDLLNRSPLMGRTED